MEDLHTYIPPRNPALQGTSSWINYFLNRDSRPGNELITVESLASLPVREASGGRTMESTTRKVHDRASDKVAEMDHK